MNVEKAYNEWSAQYDTNLNKTRDLEAVSLRETLGDTAFRNCLEIGCGTGKNTEWLITKGDEILAVDLSEEMLAIARRKVISDQVAFRKFDITTPWSFKADSFDLAVCSLVLEHIENLNDIFEKLSKVLQNNAILYIGELHPFKQYSGSKARYRQGEEEVIVNCYIHNISDFTGAAQAFGFQVIEIKEYFDDNNRSEIPRILTLKFLLQK
ncbi:class I SAM-dependent DNA methyltransferase [Gynurincola endophyticus]|uniref:class I SAM-dependent DNA methyltransferase n=1 Tax=Gynurincola endophyticus TaxID=2479004 RepID=UPI000F8DE756|nr:class I SAM-dependent methyltransferase [Gynurincola endophyticus]